MAGKTPNINDAEHARIRVALCQVQTREWALDENLARTIAALETAAAQQADIAITPECVLHGYAAARPGDESQARLLAAAEPLDGPRLTQVRRKAEELRLNVLIGFAERGAGDRVHNAAALIAADGEILDVYRKVHCRPFEDINHNGLFTPGDEFSVTTLERRGVQVRIGTMICFDREIPESVRSLRALGAELVLCPLATDTSPLDSPENCADNEMITRCRAAENEVFIVVVNHAAKYNGGSFAVGPGGESLCQMGPDEGVLVQDIPIGVIASEFHSRPLGWMGWGYRRPEVYVKYL